MAMQETYTTTRDNLFAASQIMPVVNDSLLIAQVAGGLKRGALVGADGALVGASGEVYAVLAEDVDTTDGAKLAAVYLTGEFNKNALTVAEGATVDGLKASARKVGIFLKDSISVK